MSRNNPITSKGGYGHRHCDCCGKEFFVTSTTDYTFNRVLKIGETNKTLYFCKYSCMKKFDDQYEQDKIKHMEEAQKRAWRKRKGKADV